MPRLVGKFTYDDVDQKGVDGAVNGLAESHRREPAGSCATSSPVGSSGTRCSCSRAVGLLSLVLLLANF